MKLAAVDIQGYELSEGFCVKEMTFDDGNQISHFLFKAPREYETLSLNEKKIITHLENKYHGIRYSNGYIPYTELDNILSDLLSGIDLIYVKGHQKMDFLQSKILFLNMDISPQVVNLETINDWNTLNLTLQRPLCMSHKGSGPWMCSMTNSKEIMKWVMNFLPK